MKPKMAKMRFKMAKMRPNMVKMKPNMGSKNTSMHAWIHIQTFAKKVTRETSKTDASKDPGGVPPTSTILVFIFVIFCPYSFKGVVPSWVVFKGVVNIKVMHHASIVIKEEYVSISAKEGCIALPIHRIRILVDTMSWGFLG